MIVVDSSVWIATLRGLNHPAVRRLHALVEDDAPILVGDLVLLEVLQGARDEATAFRIERDLRQFPILPMLTVQAAVQAAWNYRRLRSAGIAIRKTADLIIGTFCIESGHVLLHNDRDFDPIAAHLGLRVVTH